MGGRPRKLDDGKRAHAVDLYRKGNHTVKEICDLMGVSRTTLYAYLAESSSTGADGEHG